MDVDHWLSYAPWCAAVAALLNDHHLKGGGLTLRLKVACLRLKPLESFPAESRLKARSAL